MARLIVVRHGETDYNHEGRYQGSIDVGLNENGRRQARLVVEELQSRSIDCIISSPLKRARTTAEIIAASLHLEVELIGEFAERSLGSFEGKTKKELLAGDPHLIDRNITRQIYAAPPEGESLFEFGSRVNRGLDMLKQRGADQNILLVCHGGVVRTLHGLFRRIPDHELFDYRLENCQMDEYEW
jgi:probable phosphoglycerate mutase